MKLDLAKWLTSDLRSAALAVLNLCLVAVFFFVLLDGTQFDDILATKGKESHGTELDVGVRPSPEAGMFDVLQSQPLFHASRTFYTTPDPAVAAANLPAPDYRIAGAMSMPNKAMMAFLVHNQTGERVKVQKGDTLEGWSVEQVTGKSVLLAMNDRKAEITSQRQNGTASTGLRVAAAAPTPNESSQSGLRVLSGPATRRFSSASAIPLPKPPPGGIGARLYQPPPSQ